MASPITKPGYRKGQSPASKSNTYPAEVLTPDEVRALLAECSPISSYGLRHRALITLLYRTGLLLGREPRGRGVVPPGISVGGPG